MPPWPGSIITSFFAPAGLGAGADLVMCSCCAALAEREPNAAMANPSPDNNSWRRVAVAGKGWKCRNLFRGFNISPLPSEKCRMLYVIEYLFYSFDLRTITFYEYCVVNDVMTE